jgi:tripartite-type tricarboxylate transporter receptor subunit TctC
LASAEIFFSDAVTSDRSGALIVALARCAGSASHLCGLMFMSAIEAKLTSVYYKGGSPALNDIIAGHIDVYCDPATGPTPYIQAGTIPGYAITSQKRVAEAAED